eukprot:g5734.t1
MAHPSGFARFASGGVASLLLFLGRTSAQCVQVDNVVFEPSCENACDSGTPFTFTMEGDASVVNNKVNVVIVVDGSGSIGGDSKDDAENDWLASKNFAKDTVAAFADENLFVNGGTASFVQFSGSANPGGTFSSQADFDAFVDAEEQLGSSTVISSGINAGQELLNAAPEASASFMVVTTDGQGGEVLGAADAAREAGTILFAVGVGPFPTETTLTEIAGGKDNQFSVDNFDELDATPAPVMPTPAPVTPTTEPVTPATPAPVTPAPTPEFSFSFSFWHDDKDDSYSSDNRGGPTCSNGVLGVESDNGDVCCVAECGKCGGVGCSKFSPDLGADDCCVTEILDDGEDCYVWGAAPCIISGSPPAPAPTPMMPTSPTDMTCSNGIHGVESDNGDVCCVAECGKCGGVGCSKFSPDLDADDCCVTEIRDFGDACSASGAAPCYVDEDVSL